jgi:hypothetical protein
MDAGTISRDQQNIAGISSTRLTLVSQYNADAANVNRAQFRDVRLPYHIDPNGETQCAN